MTRETPVPETVAEAVDSARPQVFAEVKEALKGAAAREAAYRACMEGDGTNGIVDKAVEAAFAQLQRQETKGEEAK